MAFVKLFFNGTLYAKNLKRFFPWGICYGLILLAVTAGMEILNYTNYRHSEPGSASSRLIYFAGSQASFILALVIPLAAVVTAMLMYSYLFSDSSAHMLHALPVRRETHFGSVFLSGMTLQLIPIAVSEGVMILFSIGIGSGELLLLHWKLMGLFAAGSVLFFSIASVCAMLSAHILMLPAFFVIVNFVSPWIELLIYMLRNFFLPGIGEFHLPRKLGGLFCPMGELLFNGTDVTYLSESEAEGSWHFSVNWPLILGYLVAAAVILALSVWLYRRRSIECAGEILAFPVVSWPIEALSATVTGVLLIALFSVAQDTLTKTAVILLFLAGSVFGFFAVRMLIQRKFFIFRTVWKGFLVFSLLSLAILLGSCFDVMGLQTRVPKAENVSSVTVLSGTVSDPALIEKTLELNSRIVSDLDALTPVSISTGRETDLKRICLEYHLRGGCTVTRQYDLLYTDEDLYDETSLAYQYFQLLNDPAVIRSLLLTEDFEPGDLLEVQLISYDQAESPYESDPYGCTGKEQELRVFAEALMGDIESGHVLVRMSGLNGDADRMNQFFLSENTLFQQELRLTLQSRDGDQITRWIPLQGSMTETIAALTDLGWIGEDHPLTVSLS